MKVLTVVGARPQFIKASAVSTELRNQPHIDEVLVHTGQHFDPEMSDIFFREMALPNPDFHLGISGGKHGEMTGRMLCGLEDLIDSEKPNILMVYGDTNSTLAGALAAVKMHVPVAHVEAGLRSYNISMPEEVNRVLTDRISQILFCPTQQAVKNLESENFANLNVQIFNVGDVMQDVAFALSKQAQCPGALKGIEKADFLLATIHRAENTNYFERLSGIVNGLNRLHEKQSVVLPLHPRTKAALEKFGLNPNVKIIHPVGYLEMIWLLKNCQCVITDSGGLQKEAYFFSRPCVTVRHETEWIELVEFGANVLVEAQPNKIFHAVENMKKKQIEYLPELYGGGFASERIVATINNIEI